MASRRSPRDRDRSGRLHLRQVGGRASDGRHAAPHRGICHMARGGFYLSSCPCRPFQGRGGLSGFRGRCWCAGCDGLHYVSIPDCDLPTILVEEGGCFIAVSFSPAEGTVSTSQSVRIAPLEGPEFVGGGVTGLDRCVLREDQAVILEGRYDGRAIEAAIESMVASIEDPAVTLQR